MLDVNDLYVNLSKKEIVHDVSFSVSDGEFVGIIGPNGSGKSTLLKTVYRVNKAAGGIILLMGEDIKDLTMKETALKQAVVAQHNYYNFDFTVLEVALMGRSPHKQRMELDTSEDRKIAEEALDRVGMLEMKDRNFYTLSGGEQQRVILARALTQQTPFIILDEPTNHLDIKYQLQLMDTIKLLNVTVLCALHDLNIAAQYCDRLILMSQGKVFAAGTPDEILTPENIKQVYDVDVTVERRPETGLLNIIYHPNYMKGMKGARAPADVIGPAVPDVHSVSEKMHAERAMEHLPRQAVL